MAAIADDDLKVLPGGALVVQGLGELRRGEHTVAALLVSIGSPRLRSLGLSVPDPLSGPEDALYALLAESEPDAAHGRYNALVRTLVSFERALACAAR